VSEGERGERGRKRGGGGSNQQPASCSREHCGKGRQKKRRNSRRETPDGRRRKVEGERGDRTRNGGNAGATRERERERERERGRVLNSRKIRETAIVAGRAEENCRKPQQRPRDCITHRRDGEKCSSILWPPRGGPSTFSCQPWRFMGLGYSSRSLSRARLASRVCFSGCYSREL